jgi:hypothetical protein
MTTGQIGLIGCIATDDGPAFIVSKNGTEGVTVMLKLDDGTRLTWSGWLTEKTGTDGRTGADRTAEQLAYLGYDAATGAFKAKSALVDVQLESFTGDDGVTREVRKAAWIRDPNRGPKYEAMTPAQATGAKARLKAAALAAAKNAPKLPKAMKPVAPASSDDEALPFD